MALDINGYNATFRAFVNFAQQREAANDGKAVIDVTQCVGCAEEIQQCLRNEFKQQSADQHDAHGREDRDPGRLPYTLLPACAEIVGDDGDKRVVHADHRHEDEALDLVVGAERRRCRLGEVPFQ